MLSYFPEFYETWNKKALCQVEPAVLYGKTSALRSRSPSHMVRWESEVTWSVTLTTVFRLTRDRFWITNEQVQKKWKCEDIVKRALSCGLKSLLQVSAVALWDLGHWSWTSVLHFHWNISHMLSEFSRSWFTKIEMESSNVNVQCNKLYM